MSITSTTESVWQEVECGGYSADLPLFGELAAAGGRVLDLGAGIGRVALHLARQGHDVTALDRDESLLAALETRAGERGLEIETVCADVPSFDLAPRTFGLVLAPMQLVQLLDEDGRRAALQRIAAHLQPGGKAALAVVDGALPPASASDGNGPLPDVLERDGWVYSSLPTGVRTEDGTIIVERLRQTVSPAGELRESTSTDRLAVVNAADIEAEAADAGLLGGTRVPLPEADEHVASTVVLVEAPHA